MSKCTGKKQECGDSENHHYTGEGTFDGQKGECELDPFKNVKRK